MNANANRNYNCKRCNSVIKFKSTGFGDFWTPVILETSIEVYNVLELLLPSCDIYQIGGSTNASISYSSFSFGHLLPNDTGITGRERLIRSLSSARFCFKLSGNSN